MTFLSSQSFDLRPTNLTHVKSPTAFPWGAPQPVPDTEHWTSSSSDVCFQLRDKRYIWLNYYMCIVMWVGIHKFAISQLPISAPIPERLEYYVLFAAPINSHRQSVYIRSYSLFFIEVRILPFWILNCSTVCFLSLDWAHLAAIPQTTIITSLPSCAGASYSFYRMVKVVNGIIFIWDAVKTWCQSYEKLPCKKMEEGFTSRREILNERKTM